MRKIPKLRFKEFSDEWEEFYIKDLVKKKIIEKPLDGNHGNLHPTSSDYVEKGIPFIMANDIINDRVDFKNCKKISKNLAQTLQKGFAKTNDVLLTHKGTLGRTCIVPELNYDYIILTPQVTYYRIIIKEKLKNTFLKNYFNSNEFVKNLVKIGASGTRPYIGILEQLNLKIAFPSIQEQEKIANFLSSVDKKISLTEEKLELFREYKKGVMQKIFSQELRFKDSNGNDYPEWEEKRLGEIGEIIGGGTPPSGIIEYWNGNIQWFTPSEIGKNKYVNKSLRTITEIGLKNSSAKLLPKGTILLSSRATIGEKSIALEKVTTNQGFQSIFVNEKNYNEFIYYLLDYIKPELIKKATGSTFLEIGAKSLKEISTKLPTLEEQKKIANFLSSIDSKIENMEKELEGLKEFKKGLLQQMFV